MKFHHLIEINDPLNPLIDPLSRGQLWQGLVLRAEAPQMFMPWLDSCTLLERSPTALSRELRFGTLLVRDTVTFIPQERIEYAVPEQKDIAASSLVMTIEEPQPEVFFVRFDYDDGNGEAQSAEQAMYNDFRRSAYVEADIDTIRVIRQLASEGRFDTPPM